MITIMIRTLGRTLSSLAEIANAQLLLYTIRFIQFVLAIAVVGLYGTDLNHAEKPEEYTQSKWVGKYVLYQNPS